MRVTLVQESARHLEITRARQMRVDTRDLAEASLGAISRAELINGPFQKLSLWTISKAEFMALTQNLIFFGLGQKLLHLE